MSLRIRHIRRPISYLPLLPFLMVAAGCTEEYELGQPIEMGPWTFEVSGASQGTTSGGSRAKTIRVDLVLHNYEERHRQTFDQFLENCSEGMMTICNPRIGVEDDEGNQFQAVDVRPVSGGSMRSRRWIVECPLYYGSRENPMSMDWDESAARHLDKRPADFRVIIRNPDPQRGQPRRVSIQLR
jgi:hypothetical protein